MNDVNNYAYQNRVLLGQISQMLAHNMSLYQSASAPYANSTYRYPMSMSHPTMFNQLQGLVTSVAGEEIGGLMGLFANPAVRAFLPQPVNETLSTLMSSPQLGGVNDPAAFMLSQVSKNIGRGAPAITVPFDFTNVKATDAYIAQSKAFADYAGQFGFEADGSTAVETLSMDSTKANLNRVAAARNAIRVQRENLAFSNTFELFNAMNIFGPSVDTDTLMKDLTDIKDESRATEFLNQTENKSRVDALLSKAEQASGLMSAANYLSGFMGGNAAENAAANSFGDFIRDTLSIGNDFKTFFPGAAQSIANIGGLNVAMGTDDKGENLPIANILAARVASAIEGKNPNGQFSTLNSMGFGRTQDLISTLSNSGMVSTGGVDVYGTLKEEDVAKLEESMLRQLEGFGKIAETGRRLGLKTNELIQNLQGMYGGRTNEVLNTKANEILQTLETNVIGGMTEADKLVDAENMRRAKEKLPTITGDDERREFLRIEAQRRAGSALGKELAQTIEMGKMAGVDARGVMAMTTTATQILENMGMTGEGALALTQQGLTYSAMSRNTGGTPITSAQGLSMAAGTMAAAQEDPSVKAYATVRLAIEQGRLSKEDPKVAALLKKFERGEALEEAEAAELMGAAAYTTYSAEVNQHISKYAPEIMAYKARDVEKFYKSKVEAFAGEGGAAIIDQLGDKFILAINDVQAAKRDGATVEDIKAKLIKDYGLDDTQAQNLLSAAMTRDINVSGLPEGLQSQAGAEVLVQQLAFSVENGIDVSSSMKLFVNANEEFSRRLYEQMRNGQVGTNIKNQFDAMRKKKIDELVAGGMTADAARAKVDKDGFTFDEYIQGLSGLAAAEGEEELAKLRVQVEDELANTSEDNKNRKIELENVKALIDATEKQIKRNKSSKTATPDGTQEKPPTTTTDADKNKDKTSTEGQTATDAATDNKGGETGQVAASSGGAGSTTDPNVGTQGTSTTNNTPPLNSKDIEDLKNALKQAVDKLDKIKEAVAAVAERVVRSAI